MTSGSPEGRFEDFASSVRHGRRYASSRRSVLRDASFVQDCP
jgi:hypothetical protein